MSSLYFVVLTIVFLLILNFPDSFTEFRNSAELSGGALPYTGGFVPSGNFT